MTYYCRICEDGTVLCSLCQGTGKDPRCIMPRCQKCDGAGQHKCGACNGTSYVEE